MTDPRTNIQPPPEVAPNVLELVEVAAALSAIVPVAVEKIDGVLGGGSLLTFGAEALAQVYELIGPAVRDLARGKDRAAVMADLDSAIADLIERMRFGVTP